MFDEVQSGMGRTGRMFAAEHFGVVPDVMVLAKGIASGMPLGAMMAQTRAHDLARGQPRLDLAGNPVCIAAALATIDLLEGGLVDNAARVGALLQGAAGGQAWPGNPAVEEVRGLGLMIGVELRTPERPTPWRNSASAAGCWCSSAGSKAIRFAPPPARSSEAQAATAAAGRSRSACTDARAETRGREPTTAGRRRPSSDVDCASLAARQGERVFYTWSAQNDGRAAGDRLGQRARASRPPTARAGSTSAA